MIPVIISPLIPIIAAGMLYISTFAVDIAPGWKHGEINGYHWEGKVYNNPSEMGIDNGKISKLIITKNGKDVVRYDRGWVIPPGNEEDARIINEIQKQVGDKK